MHATRDYKENLKIHYMIILEL